MTTTIQRISGLHGHGLVALKRAAAIVDAGMRTSAVHTAWKLREAMDARQDFPTLTDVLFGPAPQAVQYDGAMMDKGLSESLNETLGRIWSSKVRRSVRDRGVLQTARNLRKQGIPLGTTRLLLLGRM